jgi:RES domain-containing protein
MAFLRSGPFSLFRICDARFDALDGGGAELHGGRWNPKGTPVVYCSMSLELAILEKRVHASGKIPRNQLRHSIAVPSNLDFEEIEAIDLTPDWRGRQGFTQSIGEEWVRSARTVGLIVPSAVTDDSAVKNVLLNPVHPEFCAIQVETSKEMRWDPRLWDLSESATTLTPAE